MSSGSAHYTNHYASYRMNPNNFKGSERDFVENHNNSIPSRLNVLNSSSSLNVLTESGSSITSPTTSGAYMSHSYYGNCGSVISSCVG